MRKCKHGFYKTRLYNIWLQMRQRCYTKTYNQYHNYGGRGIRVCSDWWEFISFREWALSNGYEEFLTLERKNVNGNYSPENCTWIAKREQNNNTTRTTALTAWGETKTVTEWSRDPRCKVSYTTLFYRVKKTSMSTEDALQLI